MGQVRVVTLGEPPAGPKTGSPGKAENPVDNTIMPPPSRDDGGLVPRLPQQKAGKLNPTPKPLLPTKGEAAAISETAGAQTFLNYMVPCIRGKGAGCADAGADLPWWRNEDGTQKPYRPLAQVEKDGIWEEAGKNGTELRESMGKCCLHHLFLTCPVRDVSND